MTCSAGTLITLYRRRVVEQVVVVTALESLSFLPVRRWVNHPPTDASGRSTLLEVLLVRIEALCRRAVKCQV